MADKHTPGPWMYVTQADWPHRQAVYVTAPKWGVVATVNIDPGFPHLVDAQKANLRLIAVAPELLEALRELVEEATAVWEYGEDYPHIEKARAAIAKSTGGEPAKAPEVIPGTHAALDSLSIRGDV